MENKYEVTTKRLPGGKVSKVLRDNLNYIQGLHRDYQRSYRTDTPHTVIPSHYSNFFDLEIPCWFDECEDLRLKYKEELSKLETKGCTSCQRNGLKNKYRRLLKDIPGVSDTNPVKIVEPPPIPRIPTKRDYQDITLFLGGRLLRSDLGQGIKEICEQKAMTFVNSEKPSKERRQAVKDSPNTVTWGLGHHKDVYTNNGKNNVLYIENGLLRQRTGILMDDMGFFTDSSICKLKKYDLDYTNEELEQLREHVDSHIGPFMSGGDPNGPILITLQKNKDATLRRHFPACKSTSRLKFAIQELAKYLPKGPQYIIRPHPRNISDWSDVEKETMNSINRDDFSVSTESDFYTILPTCSRLVTVSSTTAVEALAAGIPVGVLGQHVWTGSSGVFLDCSEDLSKISNILDWKFDEEKVFKFLCAVFRQHVSYNISKEDLLKNEQFNNWLNNLKIKS